MKGNMTLAKPRWLLVVTFVTGVFMQACSSDDDMTLLQSSLSGLIQAVEEKEPRTVRRYLSRDFLAQRNQGRTDVERIMLVYFRQNQNISIYTLEEDIQIKEDRAELSLIAVVTGASNFLPERGGKYLVDMLWQKEEGDWLLRRLNWERQELLAE
ncbi:MAG: hypothetical protein OQK73_06990 [Gammaproteobacteria bacterium]|nr:hypothetical protein [Gammaproteobacteria bacterium]